MLSQCPACHAAVEPGNRFCPGCGRSLRDPAAVDDRPVLDDRTESPVPAPHATGPLGLRLPWYRRKRLVVPLTLVAVLLLTLGAGTWYIAERFEQLGALSTPPPEISGARLGGEGELQDDDQGVHAGSHPHVGGGRPRGLVRVE